MAIENFNEDVEVIQKLDTLPNQEGGLSAEELKAKFDQAAMAIKNFINNSLLPVVRELEEAKDPSIIYSLDQTLSELGRAADAKAVGDALAGKVSVADIINNLTTNVANKPLSAAQGVVLKGLIYAVSSSLSNYQPKGDYALRSELPTVPTKVSQLQNDKGYLTEHQDISGKLDASALPTAINTALAQAKDSGEFDGADGKDGVDGKDGQDGYTPQKGIDYFDGQPGKDGADGKDGTSATHSWNGTTLTVTSASGTSSADLKGEKGDSIKGDDGISPTVAVSKSGKVTTVTITDKNGTKTATINDGADGYTPVKGKDYFDGDPGTPGTSVTVKSVSESTADGGSNVVTFSDGKTVTIKNGSKGNTGAAGATPEKGTDYFTPADKNEMVNSVKSALPTLTVTGVDADGNTHTWTMYGVAQ